MPPERPISSSCASVRFREFAESAYAFEWLATSGAADTAATSQKPRSFRCARSIRIPSLLHSATRRRPASVSPSPEMEDRGGRAAVKRRLDIGGRACQAHLAAPGELVEQVD